MDGMAQRTAALALLNGLLGSNANTAVCRFPDSISKVYLLNEFAGCLSCRTAAHKATCEAALGALYQAYVYPLQDELMPCLVGTQDYWTQSLLFSA